jgi:hypothetical protein
MGVGDISRMGGVWGRLSLGFSVFISVSSIHISGDPLGCVGCDRSMKTCGSSAGGGLTNFGIPRAVAIVGSCGFGEIISTSFHFLTVFGGPAFIAK